MQPDDTLPSLPAFLDRKRWTAEVWKRSEAAFNKAQARHMQERAAVEARAQEAKEAKKVKEATDAMRAQEHLATAQRRDQKRILRASVLQFVKQALDRGPVTSNALRQLVAAEKKSLIPWALRTMLKTGEAKRVSRQLYKRNK